MKKVQRFDPPGVGARDLRECLLLQLENRADQYMDQMEEAMKHSMRLALRIIDDYFDEFSKKHYQKLQRYLNISEAQLKLAIEEILKLNPKPASGHVSGSTRATHYIVPDFIIVNREGELDLTLNTRNAPDLRINDHYKDMLKSYKESSKSQRAKNSRRKRSCLLSKRSILLSGLLTPFVNASKRCTKRCTLLCSTIRFLFVR